MNNITVTEEMLDELREKVKPYLTEKRYRHTLGVEREAARLGEMFLPEKVNKLRASALLHDITKLLSLEKQLQYCRKFDIIFRNSDLLSPKIFHAKTGAAFAGEIFPEYTDDEILDGIRYHTTGRRGMNLFEAMVYLADYIEDTRTFDDCIKLRNYFYGEIEKGRDKNEVFTDTMIMSFNMTVNILVSENAPIDCDTIEARNFYIEQKVERKVQTEEN